MSRTRDVIWMRNAKSKNFADPEYLWDHLWPKYNTISLPIHDESLFFADALAAAKDAEDQVQLEDLMQKKLGERQKEMRSLLLKVAYAVDENRDVLPSPNSREMASKTCQTGCLDNFLQFLGRSTFGWGDETHEPQQQPRIKNGYVSDTWNDADMNPDHPDFQTQPGDSEVEMIIPTSPPRRTGASQRNRRRIRTVTEASTSHDASPTMSHFGIVEDTTATHIPTVAFDSRSLKKKKVERRRQVARATSSGAAHEEMRKVAQGCDSLTRSASTKRALHTANDNEENENVDESRQRKRRATDERIRCQSTRAFSSPPPPPMLALEEELPGDSKVVHPPGYSGRRTSTRRRNTPRQCRLLKNLEVEAKVP